MRNLFIIFFFFNSLNCVSQGYFCVGINVSGEAPLLIGYGTPPDVDLVGKNFLSLTYGYGIASLEVGVGYYREKYSLTEPAKYFNRTDFYFKILCMPVNLSFDFKNKPNTLFFGFNNEIVFSTYAEKVIYIKTFLDPNYIERTEINGTKFSNVNIQIGFGYRFLLKNKFYAKIFPYYSWNQSGKNILENRSRFDRLGCMVGVYYKFRNS